MTLKLLTRLYFGIQRQLLPALEEEIGPLDDKAKQFVNVCEMLHLETHLEACVWLGNGRPPKSRFILAQAFVAKALWNIPTTKDLLRQLRQNTTLRRLCGWHDGPRSVPDESTFSRAFATFANIGLGQRVHETLMATHLGSEVIWHCGTDGTAIEARESVAKAVEAPVVQEQAPSEVKPKRKRGRPRKGEEPPPPEPTRLQRHLEGTLEANMKDMPQVQCDYGCKKNSQGNTDWWRGYKLHIATGDGDIPLYAYLSSASMHDSQAAIIIEQQVAERTRGVLYQLKDSAYDAQAIREHSGRVGSVPIIEKRNYRSEDAIPMEPDRARHYRARSSSERVNSDLKDNHGGRSVRVRGGAKVATHLMFGILVMSAEALLRLVV